VTTMRSALLCSVFFVFCVYVLASPEYVLTPYGYRLKQCVLEVPHGSLVAPNGPGSVSVKIPGEAITKLVDVPAECDEDIQSIRAAQIQKRRYLERPGNMTAPFPLNGWLDYTGWYPPAGQSHLEKFTSTYTIPNNPSTASPETLFYFIGMQDNDSPQYLNIIQPVLTWGNGRPSWYVQSWACCPSNITVSSPPVTGLSQGQQMNGVIERVSADVWRIDSEWHGQHTTLLAQVGGMNYNWADVTLEVYNVNSCGQFATGTFTAGALALYDQQGQQLSPSWTYTAPTACSGSIRSVNGNTITISHS